MRVDLPLSGAAGGPCAAPIGRAAARKPQLCYIPVLCLISGAADPVEKAGHVSSSMNSSRRVSGLNLRVDPETRSGWIAASEQMPVAGDEVQCTEGTALVVRVLGKTGDGSRLLELSLPDRPRQPFFAAASNVLVAPRVATA
jgi:hypothetical protein